MDGLRSRMLSRPQHAGFAVYKLCFLMACFQARQSVLGRSSASSDRLWLLALRFRACATQVSWVQPRVLTLPQVKGLSGRLGTWIGKVNAAALTLEEESIGVAEL